MANATKDSSDRKTDEKLLARMVKRRSKIAPLGKKHKKALEKVGPGRNARASDTSDGESSVDDDQGRGDVGSKADFLGWDPRKKTAR